MVPGSAPAEGYHALVTPPCKAPGPAVARPLLLAALLALSVLATPGCGEPPGPAPAAEGPWPVNAPVDTVLAYVAETVPPGWLADRLDDWVGWRPAGLDQGRPLVLALLDASVLGGHAALALPVADPEALRRSLDESPSLEALGGDRYLLTLPPDHELMRLTRMARGMVEARTLGDLMAALAEPSDTSLAWELHEAPGHALLVPSFEAAFVTRKLLEGLPLARPDGLVVSVDLERLRLAWWDELEDAENALRGLLTGASSAGLAGWMGGALQARGDGERRLSFARPWLWTALTSLEPGALGGLQLQVRAGDGGRGVLTESGELDRLARDSVLRVVWSEDTAFLRLLASLRPAPELASDDPGLSLAAEPRRFVPALVDWLRPLVEEAYGVGAPAERSLDELAGLLASWDGRLAALAGEDGPVVLIGSGGTRRLEPQALASWWADFTRGLGAEQVLELPHHALVDDVLVLFGADTDAQAVDDALLALDRAEPPSDPGAPAARLRLGDLDVGLTLADRQLDLALRATGRD